MPPSLTNNKKQNEKNHKRNHLPIRSVTVEDYDRNPPKTKSMNTRNTNNLLYIATYNVKTLSSYERLIELSEALKEIKYDIIGISEMRRSGNKIEEYNDFILCHVGQTQGQYGVGFLINKSQKQNVESFNGITERVASLNLNLQGLNLTIIQVYAPTEAAKEEEIKDFYITVNKAIEGAYKDFVLMGDFNAKIGQPRQDEYLITKQNGYGVRNERGQRLIDFALENNLAILNTFFKKRPNERWTWLSPNKQYKNEIDFVLSNRPEMFQNIEVLNINYPSDHRSIRATIMLAKPKKSRARYTSGKVSSLKSDKEILHYKECLKTHLTDLIAWDTNMAVQTYHDKIMNAIKQSLQQAKIAKNNTNTHKILQERTTTLIKRRQELQKTKNKTRSMKNELSALYKLISKYIKKDYAMYRSNTIEKHLERAGSTKKAYKELRTNKTWIEGLNRSGKTICNRSDIIDIATEFYRILYSANANTRISYDKEEIMHKSSNQNIKAIDGKEIIEAVKRLKYDKSPGSDNITNEAIKTACPMLVLPLANLFNLILKNAITPSQWSESNIILIYKKGDPKDISNYRPISLLPSLYKLFSSIINQRISTTLETKQPVEQAGFRKGYSTIDHIHTLELLIEKYQEQQRPLFIAFIDYQKAFDTVSHASIWKTLEAQKVENEYIQVIKSIYKNSTSRVKLETIGPSFPIKRGVRQGDPLSPKIFIALLESIINKLGWEKYGISIKGRHLSHLRFADDLVLLSETSSQLQIMIESLHVASKQVGLEMNIAKTMTMTNGTKRIITVGDVPLKYTDKYIYLGKQIGFDRINNELEIERRTQYTWNKYWSLKDIFKSNMPVHLKTKVMTSCLLPSLTYACQTWKFTNKIKNKIITCQRGIERSMLNIKKIQKIRHTKISKITKATNALCYAQKLKWKWAGHVARLQDQRWTKRVTLWKGPQGKRCQGRPHARWEDDIKKTAGPHWHQIAQDRDQWLSLEEAFTCEGVLAE